jgi:microcystin-dependent protein
MTNLPIRGETDSLDNLAVTREEFRVGIGQLLEYLAQALGAVDTSYDDQAVDPLAVILQGEPSLSIDAVPPAEDNSRRFVCSSWVRDYVTALNLAVPAGVVAYIARDSAPDGWLKANGAAISRTAYADLFAATGTVFGAGDGTTTFNLPDLRAEFIRGWDDGRGIDAARAFGSAQAHMFQSHFHNISGFSGSNNLTPGAHFYNTNQVNTTAGTSNPASGNTGSETRPRNIALLPVIKF